MRAVVVPAVVALVSTLVLSASAPAYAGGRTEAVAKAALKKAKADFSAMNYGSGATRLQKALRACGDTKCTPETRAALLLDIGAMQLKKGSKDEASLSFAAAVKASPAAALQPPFDQPDVVTAFNAAAHPTGAGAAGGASDTGGGTQPTGDFGHTPPAAQAVNTPLPIYVDGGPDSVVRVVVKYKPDGASSWKRITLKKMDSGWAGLLPCGDVTSGTLRYYVQGFDDSKTPVASNGDARHPYTVPIKDSITGEAPHLPGKDPPKSCSETSDCPPDFPGCSKSGENAGAEGDDNGDDAGDTEAKGPAGPFKRWWVGLGAELEFLSVPSDNDVCALDPNSALPVNGSNLYCTTQSDQDFPTRQTKTENQQLCTAQAAAAGECPGDAGGSSAGGFVRGNMRLMASVDYAFTTNLLVGGRLGFTVFNYPGSAAGSDGRAFTSRFYGELRGTWVFGKDALATTGFKPMVFGGGGVGEFDGHVSTGVAYCNNPLTPGVKCTSFSTGTVNVWKTAGPGFVDLGGGVRWEATQNIAFTGALRLNVAFGGGGILPTFGPEIDAAFGF